DCASAPYGCDLISTATWKGASLRDVLSLAGGATPDAQSLVVSSADEYSATIPADDATLDGTLLVYEMNGAVLPLEHGYPARLLVPGRFGMKSPKWVVSISPTADVPPDWYGQRGWSATAVVQTMTRIDVPGDGQALPAGEQQIAGIAYAGSRGIARVEFSADGGQSWQPATFMEPAAGSDAWVRWSGSFTLSGPTRLVARAVDGSGAPQVETPSPPQPDGATGLHTIQVNVANG